MSPTEQTICVPVYAVRLAGYVGTTSHFTDVDKAIAKVREVLEKGVVGDVSVRTAHLPLDEAERLTEQTMEKAG